MKLTLVRHGQTEYNYEQKIQGISNIPLNDTGRRQCKKLKEQIKEKKYDICFSSPLVRAMETAMILVGEKVQINMDARLIERNMGNLENSNREKYDIKKYWDYNLNCDDNNVERIQDIFDRCNRFINYIKENYEDKSILIVSHGAPIRAIHHILNKTELNTNLVDFEIDNCYIEEIYTK